MRVLRRKKRNGSYLLDALYKQTPLHFTRGVWYGTHPWISNWTKLWFWIDSFLGPKLLTSLGYLFCETTNFGCLSFKII